ncbi:MAG: hypothetical protein AUI14_04975 [Actinobacteria bacterium 13_2_20CM_2_71_6]|nr:MAG: hypothetical protein AUI14_04975 [Actinobacteria bacterium 13_2_20CM_2_71_6]
MTITQSQDGVQPFLNEELSEEAKRAIAALAIWRRQTPASALETEPAPITGDPPYVPPSFLPDGIDELTVDEYKALFGAPPPPPAEDPILAHLRAIDGRLTLISAQIDSVKDSVRLLTERVKKLEDKVFPTGGDGGTNPADSAPNAGKPTSTSK